MHVLLLLTSQQIIKVTEPVDCSSYFLFSFYWCPCAKRKTNINSADEKRRVDRERRLEAVLADDLTHSSDIFAWRQHHYCAIVSQDDAATVSLSRSSNVVATIASVASYSYSNDTCVLQLTQVD